MPLKFVTNQITTTEQNATIGNPATTVDEVTTTSKFIPEAITDYDGTGSTTGFSLAFTDGATYDLDEILFNIRRDNPESPLLMQVVTENSQFENLIKISTNEILNEYFNETFLAANPDVIPSINLVPNFSSLLEQKYQEKLGDLGLVDESELAEGSLTINSTQPQIGVKREDMVKYLLSNRPAQRVTPLINLNRPLALWTDISGGDLNTPDDTSAFRTMSNYIAELEAEIEALTGE